MSKRRRFPFVIILRDARVLLLTLLLLLMLLGPRQTTGLMNSASEATSLPGHSFSHMELYELGGEEFLAIAQTNELINLRADFTAKYVTRTGPRNDSLTCSPNQILLTVLDINRQCQVHPRNVVYPEVLTGE